MAYTDEQLLQILRDFNIEHGRIPTGADFRKSKPNTSTFINRFNSWSNAIKFAGLKKDKFKITGYSDGELIEYLHQYYNEFGKVPTTREFKKNKNYPSPYTYETRFGSWKNALLKADLYELRKDKNLFSRRTYSDEELIQLLKDFSVKFYKKYNRLPTNNDIALDNAMPHSTLYARRFDKGIIGLYMELGFDVDEVYIRYGNTFQKDNNTILQQYIDLYNKYGQVDCNNLTKYGLPSLDTYLRRFNIDSYFDLIKLAGFEPNYHNNGIRLISDEEVIKQFYDIESALGRIPTLKEMIEYCKENELPPIDGKIQWRWKSYSKFLKDIGKLSPRKQRMYFSKDGRRCFSRYEEVISNYLYKNAIIYNKDIPYKKIFDNFNQEWTVDYYLPFYDIYIEVFGIIGNEKYNERMFLKQQIFKESHLNLISITPQDFTDNNYKMDKFLDDTIANFTESKYKINRNTIDDVQDLANEIYNQGGDKNEK